jgi:hypothetical protein
MLAYYISGSNGYTIRTQPTASNQFVFLLQDMTTQYNTTASLTNIQFEGYESYLSFTASISGAIIGGEYRAQILNSGSDEPIWHGSVQVYTSQSEDKPAYVNQNDGFTSYDDSSNTYIIIK